MEEIQAMSKLWTTQTEIYCDTFWLQSFGTRNGYLANTKNMFCTAVIALFYFVSEGNVQVQAPGGLYSEGWFNGGAYFRNFTAISWLILILIIVDGFTYILIRV